MATGVVFLQTAANPYVALLGSQETAPARLNLTQALNGVGTTIAPFLAGIFVLAPAVIAINSGATAGEAAKYVQMPFVIIGSIVIIIAIGIIFIKLPKIQRENIITSKSVLKKPQVWLGALGIFFYVGAEVGTAGQIAPYLKTNGIGLDVAVKLSAIYWGGAMVGRFFRYYFIRETTYIKEVSIFCLRYDICFFCRMVHNISLSYKRTICL